MYFIVSGKFSLPLSTRSFTYTVVHINNFAHHYVFYLQPGRYIGIYPNQLLVH